MHVQVALARALLLRSSTHHCHSVTRHDGARVQNSVVGHVGEDVDDGDKGHGDGDGQGQIPGRTRRRVTSVLPLAALSPFLISYSDFKCTFLGF